MSKMNEVFKKVINDRDIFYSPYEKRLSLILFESSDWAELRMLFEKKKKKEFIAKIDKRIKELEKEELNITQEEDNNIIENLKEKAEWLKSAFDERPYLLRDLLENLEWWPGVVKCRLPNMDNYGAFIENYNMIMVKLYFIDNIKRNYKDKKKRKALEKVLEYINELYDAGVPSEEIAFFVRKLNSLTKYWEVIEK